MHDLIILFLSIIIFLSPIFVILLCEYFGDRKFRKAIEAFSPPNAMSDEEFHDYVIDSVVKGLPENSEVRQSLLSKKKGVPIRDCAERRFYEYEYEKQSNATDETL